MRTLVRSAACFALAIAASMALVGCGGSSNDAASTGAATGTEVTQSTVNVNLKEWSITPDTSTVKAGEITFRVKNAGNVVHEMVIAKTDLAPEHLPLFTAGSTIEEGHSVGDVDEDQLDSPGEVADIPVGQTSTGTFRLEPGKYVLFCNLPGHYKLGMFTTFTVE